MTSLATIGLTLATHPLQMLMAVVALYHAGAALFASRSFNRDRPRRTAGKSTRSTHAGEATAWEVVNRHEAGPVAFARIGGGESA